MQDCSNSSVCNGVTAVLCYIIQLVALITQSDLTWHGMVMTKEHNSDLKPTEDTPYLALMGKLWNVYGQDLGENQLSYNHTVTSSHSCSSQDEILEIQRRYVNQHSRWHENWFYCVLMSKTWWHHQMETFSTLLAFCAGISPVNSPHKGQWRGALMFSLKRLSKQWWGWWFEMPSHSLWCHCNDTLKFQCNALDWVLSRHNPYLLNEWNCFGNRNITQVF